MVTCLIAFYKNNAYTECFPEKDYFDAIHIVLWCVTSEKSFVVLNNRKYLF
jgi:hypothetical protein